MKKSILYGLLAVASLSLTSCDDLLNDNRFPLDQQTNNAEYWNTSANITLQLNYLYSYYTGYGNGATWVSNFYYRSLNDDQCAHMYSGSGVTFARWEYEEAPTNTSEWSDGYTRIRRINNIIEGVSGSKVADKEKNNALAIARLNRAYQYYQLVRCFGDVQLIDKVLDPSDTEELYGKRDPRNKVMDFVYEDLQFAVDNIVAQSNKIEFSKDMANAMKAEICLFEAAYAKYHLNDTERAKKFYEAVVTACEAIMNQNYSLCADYQSLYNSLGADLKSNPEVIFMKQYEGGVLCHSLMKYLSTSVTIAGMTKDAFDSYLFLDGKPKSSTTLDKSDAAVVIGDIDHDAEGNPVIGNAVLSIEGPLSVRDKRLSLTIDPYISFNGGFSYTRPNSDPLISNTGYTVKKYINPTVSRNIATTDNQNYTSAPLYWLAEIYLAYAEAKAELGTFNDGDFNKTIKKLYDRAGIEGMTLNDLVTMNDDANNMGVSSLLWEIRRCRRCELMFDNYIRYWDLVRWHKLDLLDTNKHENIVLGANVANAPADTKALIVTNANGYIEGNASANGRENRTFTDREYFYPLGKNQLELNANLTQNPGW